MMKRKKMVEVMVVRRRIKIRKVVRMLSELFQIYRCVELEFGLAKEIHQYTSKA